MTRCQFSGRSPSDIVWRTRYGDRVTCICGTRTKLYVKRLDWQGPYDTYMADHEANESLAFYEVAH